MKTQNWLKLTSYLGTRCSFCLPPYGREGASLRRA